MAERDRESRIFRESVEEIFTNADSSDYALQAVLDELPYYSARHSFGGVSGFPQFSIDFDALVFSILGVGQRGREFDSAHWFYAYLGGSFSWRKLDAAISSRRQRLELPDQTRPEISIAPILSDLAAEALLIAQRTQSNTSSSFQLHHLLVSILNSRSSLISLLAVFDRPSGVLQKAVDRARKELLGWGFENLPAANMNAWAEVLGNKDTESDTNAVASPPSPSAVLHVTSEDQIPDFSPDRPGIDAGDSLGIDPDVQAFARLICLKDVKPPLSIGLFGGWGAGKSTFMERLERAIIAITDAEAQRRENIKAGRAQPQPPEAPGFLARVAHIRFNAWQYSDANLWASLTTEFFDQLRAGGHDRQGNVVHERLVQRVKNYVRALSDDAVEAQQALTDSRRALKEARAERDLARSKVRDAQNDVLTEDAVRKIAEVYDANKSALSRLGIAVPPGDAEKAVERFTELAKQVREWPGQAKAVLSAAWHYKWKWPVLGAVAVFATSVGIVLWNPGLMPRIVGGMTAVLSFGGIVAERLREPFRIVTKIARDTAALGGKLKAVKDDAEKQLLAKQVIVQDKRAELERRKEKAEEAGNALATYSGAQGQSPSRLLHYLLNDNPETKEIEGQIGLISRARRLFHAVDKIAVEERQKDNPDEDVPERIVLYIDDLDRCSHDQVYAVLQAVHLLLAFELFVVVVGVDVAWVEEAITRQLRDGPQTQSDDENKRRKRAIDYLQKIFQIPFWLKPLSTDGNDGGSYGRFVGALAGSIAAVDTTPEIVVTGEEAKDIAGVDSELVLEPEPDTEEAAGDGDIPDGNAETIEEARTLATMRLDPREVDFLKSPAIGAIAAHDPRGVKRMINTYRLARARMSRGELDKLLNADDPTYPILALFAAIETGQPIEEIVDVIDRDLRTKNFGAEDVGEIIKARVTEQDREWRSVIEKNAPAAIVMEASKLHECWVAVEKAFAYARTMRKTHDVFVADCRPIARLVRRYSFSRKQ